MTLTFRNATSLNGKKYTIIVERGNLLKIDSTIETAGEEILLPEGTYFSPGWIDLHTHAFPKFPPYCAEPDQIGYKTGVSTVVDAGSTGAKKRVFR